MSSFDLYLAKQKNKNDWLKTIKNNSLERSIQNCLPIFFKKNTVFISLKDLLLDDIVVLSMDAAGIPSSPSQNELQQRLHEAEQRVHEADQRAHEAEQDAAREKKTRVKYYNQHCRVKKEWEKTKRLVRIDNSILKAQVSDLKKELKTKSEQINSQVELIQRKNEQIDSAEKDLNLFEAMITERDRKIQKIESEYQTLLDDVINAKVEIEYLKSAFWSVTWLFLCSFIFCILR